MQIELNCKNNWNFKTYR